MRRALTALATLATAAFTALALAAPAGAATTTEVIHFKDLTAYATWQTTTTTPTGGTNLTFTTVSASKSSQGSGLNSAYQDTFYYGADGTYLGGTSIYADNWSKVSFAIEPSLVNASLSATGLTGHMITWDPEGNVTSKDVTIGAVNAAWAGQGKISRQTTNYQTHQKGYNYISHTMGTSRPATATGTFVDTVLSTDQLLDCGMGNYSSGTISVSH
jgi:hypothetical protein